MHGSTWHWSPDVPAVDLQALHAAGAEIPSHADAWLQLGRASRYTNRRLDLVEEVMRLHRELGRNILPSDIPGPRPSGRPRRVPTGNSGTR